MNPDSATPSGPPSTSGGVRAALAILLVVAALGALAYRVQKTLTSNPPPPPRLQLGDDVQLESPPPPSSGDLETVKTNFARLEALRVEYERRKDDPNIALTFARAALQSGDYLSGRAALENVIAKRPESPLLVHDLLGRCQIELADYKKAVGTYDRLIAREPNAVQGYIGKSRALTGLKKTAEAGQVLVLAGTKIGDSDLLSHLGLAGEFDRLRDLDSALKHARKALAANPNDAPSAVLTAGILFKLRRFDEAYAILEKRISADPRDVGSRKVMAQILESALFPRRDRAMAEHYFLEVLKLMPADPDTCWRLAQMCADQGRFKQAAYLYSVLLESAPDSAAGRKQYAAALEKLGDQAAAQAQQKIARTLLERDAKIASLAARRDRNPTDAEAHAQVARAQRAANHYREALVAMQAAYNLAPKNPVYVDELGQLCTQLGLSGPGAKPVMLP
jgi:tetratricopeptide (TPR) repeat protein